MERATTRRTLRMLVVLFSMCLLISACDMEDVLQTSQATRVDGSGRTAAKERPDRPRRRPDRPDRPGRRTEDADDTDPGAGEGDPVVPDAGDPVVPDAGEGDPVVPDAGEGDPVVPDAGDPVVPDAGDGDPVVPDAGDGDPTVPDGGAGEPVDHACDHRIPSAVDEADGASNYSGVAPGDTVCITAGTRGPLELRNFHGTADRTVTFVNDGGTVNIRGGNGDYAGIQIEDSDHIRVTGSGEAQQCGASVAAGAQRCGIRILGPERSVSGKVKVEYIRLDHLEMGDTSESAVTIKDKSMGRGEWIEHDVVVDHSYIHDVYDEGVYIGSSDYATGEYHVLHGVHLAHNLVERTGRDGLQVGSATRDCTIHHNVIRDTGRNNLSSHRAGVMNNKGSVCHIYNNFVADTAGWGIYVQGNGLNEIYNNVVVRAGRAVRAGDGDGDGISIHDGSNVDNSIYVWNNTVVSARGDGIGWGNDGGSDNQIRNNIVVASGGENIDRDANVLISHNIAASSVASPSFVDPGADDYRLRTGSPARDAGATLSGGTVDADFDGVPRPQGPAFDIGAHEMKAD